MDKARAVLKYIRISPRKARLAADLIRGLPVPDASFQLRNCNLKGGRLLKKALDSAVANAKDLLALEVDQLKVSEVRVDAGPTLKRINPKSRGGHHPILKRSSHFTVVVESKD